MSHIYSYDASSSDVLAPTRPEGASKSHRRVMGKKSSASKGAAAPKPQQEPETVASLDSSAAPTRRRQLGRRNTEQQVERALKSAHFRHISEQSLHHKVVEGKDLRQSLKEIIHGLQKHQRIGSTTYSALAAKYADNHCQIESLKGAMN